MEELDYGDDAASGLRNCVRANLRYLEVRRTVIKDGKGLGRAVLAASVLDGRERRAARAGADVLNDLAAPFVA